MKNNNIEKDDFVKTTEYSKASWYILILTISFEPGDRQEYDTWSFYWKDLWIYVRKVVGERLVFGVIITVYLPKFMYLQFRSFFTT